MRVSNKIKGRGGDREGEGRKKKRGGRRRGGQMKKKELDGKKWKWTGKEREKKEYENI